MEDSLEKIVNCESIEQSEALMMHNTGFVFSPDTYRWISWWQWWGAVPSSHDSGDGCPARVLCNLTDWPEYPDRCNYPNWILGFCLNQPLRVGLVSLLTALSTDGSVNSWPLRRWRTIAPNVGADQVRSLLFWRAKKTDFLQSLRKQVVKGLNMGLIIHHHLEQKYPNLARRLHVEFGLEERPHIDNINTPEFVDGFLEAVEELATLAEFDTFSKDVSPHDFDFLIKSFSEELMSSAHSGDAALEGEEV
ncbi:hypothetical protein NQT62_03695 [Limnobacter humi]|uniref:Uncharacterized protein n=1 Tax=Limnobacter humi TaxID=1778671 RepID=A0ABT1WDU0_9BURK|nr:hypothetical protein [Limnobacter humi]MCQ8895544.1 hypothetical protein [Limnobacter humi]